MNIDKLEAGRELDALIAEKVMGCKPRLLRRADTVPDYCGCETRQHARSDDDSRIAEYSTDIAAAWEVVKKLGEFRDGPNKLYKPVIRLEYYEHDGIATVTVGRCKGIMGDATDISAEVWEEHGEANADQAMALAICRAALKAVGA